MAAVSVANVVKYFSQYKCCHIYAVEYKYKKYQYKPICYVLGENSALLKSIVSKLFMHTTFNPKTI